MVHKDGFLLSANALYLKSAEDEGDEDEESESRSSEYESASSKNSESATEVSVPLKGKVIFCVLERCRYICWLYLLGRNPADKKQSSIPCTCCFSVLTNDLS